MNRIFLMIILTWAVAAQAQILNVASTNRMDIPVTENQTLQAVAISPQGDYLLISTDMKESLLKWDLATSRLTTISTSAGAGSDVRISNDGSQVVYGEVTYKNKRRQESVKTIDLTTGKKKTLVKPTRNLQGFAIDGGSVTTLTDGVAKRHTIKKGVTTTPRPVLSHHHLKLYITRGNETTLLAPNGADERYIWASLSPDGNRVLYYVSGQGTFVCNIDGSHVIAMGNLTAPKWWDDNTIVGMSEVDDEYSIIASSIVARTLDGQEQVLTGNDVIATYPLPSSQSGKIAFSTPDGKVYLITVE